MNIKLVTVGVVSAAIQVAWGLSYLDHLARDTASERYAEARFEELEQRLVQTQAELAVQRVRTGRHTDQLQGIALLAAFGSSMGKWARIGCDGSIYPEGSNGAAAHRELVSTGLCSPPEPLPDHRLDFIPPPAQLVAQ